MKTLPKSWDVLDRGAREQATRRIITFFHDERGEEIGLIAAGEVLDFFLEHIGPMVYNQAIDDAAKAFRERLDSWDVELDLLRKRG